MKHKDKIQYWSSIIKECQNQSLSTKQWCKDNHITLSNFYKWKKYLSENSKTSAFTPVVYTEAVAEPMKLTINGVAIEFDKTLLSDILKAIQ